MTEPIIVSALFGDADFAWLDGLRRAHFPPERNIIAAHLTLFHHLPPSLLPELATRLDAETKRVARPEAMIGDAMSLGRGVALRVRSDELVAIRERLADAFAGMLTPQDRAGWLPHVTIQNKVAPDEARALHRRLSVDHAKPRPIVITSLASWRYLGGPWSLIHAHRFTG